MSFMFCLSKFISVPILTEWLMKSDILVLDSALVNNDCRPVYLKLMNEYFNLFIDSSETEMNLIEVCGWSLKFGDPNCRLNCLVRCRKYDWNMLESREGLMKTAKFVMVNVSKLECYHYNANLESAQRITDLCIVNFQNPSVKSFSNLCSLLNLKVHYQNDFFVVELLRQNPLLTSLDINYLSDSMLKCIVIHCTKLKILKSDSGDYKRKVLLILAFHCPPSLSELPEGIPELDDDENESENDDDLVVKTLLWYKGAQLTQLFIDVPRLVRNYKLFSECSRLSFCVTGVDMWTGDDSLSVINVCRSHINGCSLYGLYNSDDKINKLKNSLDLSKILSLSLDLCLGFNIKWFPCLTTLSLYGCSVTKEMFCSSGAYQHLQSVAIYNSNVDVDVMMCLLTGPNLTEVTLDHIALNNTDNFEDHYEIVTNKVNKLSLTTCFMSVALFVAVVKRCSNLTQLNVQSCYEMASQHLLDIIPYFHKLITLTKGSYDVIDDTVLDAIHNNC